MSSIELNQISSLHVGVFVPATSAEKKQQPCIVDVDALCDVDVKLAKHKPLLLLCVSLSFLTRTTQSRPIRTECRAAVTSKGPGIKGDTRGRGGPVSATLREITINS